MHASAPDKPMFTSGLEPPSATRAAIAASCRIDEAGAVAALLESARLPADQATAAHEMALGLARRLRTEPEQRARSAVVQGLLQEYALSSQEGIALMCLAEALLRIPDDATRDALIRDRIGTGGWRAHVGQSPSLFVNAATWGLLLTGQLVNAEAESGLIGSLTRLVSRSSEALIRRAVDTAVRLLGEQFVCGRTIEAALTRAAPMEQAGFLHSYDMLGEAAMTADDAERYLHNYHGAITALGRVVAGRPIHAAPGISVKLSALHPRYVRAQRERVLDELYPRLRGLAQEACGQGIALTVDAEESERLDLSLDLFDRLCAEPDLARWHGLGIAVQAYQKRCPAVIDHLIALAASTHRRLMVRLVKGAYWDSEIKRAQQDGLDYPVYTRKAHTDVAYLACARRLLGAPEQVYPQFATHNALTVASIIQLAGPQRWAAGQYEFQCLHGMGEPLYRPVSSAGGGMARPCRIYAPVGAHETLLAYLVRRLLENGANTSFVHRVADSRVPLESLVQDPVARVEQLARDGADAGGNPAIPRPAALFGAERRNSSGIDLTADSELCALAEALRACAHERPQVGTMLGADHRATGKAQPVLNPADQRERVGSVTMADADSVSLALYLATRAAPGWGATPALQRASVLERAADLLQADCLPMMALLMREAGKTSAAALGEVREAIDFLRYDAAQLRRGFDPATHQALGVVACISPWNFPLSIFCGQVAAALAAGNAVVAKPAEQTPLVAGRMVERLWQAGVPRPVLQLLPGEGERVGAMLVADARVQGVVFTGSTAVARHIQRSLAGRLDARGRPVVLIAETGGQNAMIVDSSALPEQAVADILASAFDSAGQRCSALRVLCIQDELAPRLVTMLLGAMAELRIGRPDRLATDVGPVIDHAALTRLQAHVKEMRALGARIHEPQRLGADSEFGHFMAPVLVEVGVRHLRQEVFGPVLHVVRYRRDDLPALIDAINALGFGLSFGLHTRIEHSVTEILAQVRAGNLYVNRSMIGAVVGVQAFGGEGLSGTGPKAGGPLYLYRLLGNRPQDVIGVALAGLRPAPGPAMEAHRPLLATLAGWAQKGGHGDLVELCRQFSAWVERVHRGWLFDGPTGEQNQYRLHARDAVMCLAGQDEDRLAQLAAVLAVGAQPLWPRAAGDLHARLPQALQAAVLLVDDWANASCDLVIHHGSEEARRGIATLLARREGRIVPLETYAPGDARIALDRLMVERSVCINTAATGGNATLLGSVEDN